MMKIAVLTVLGSILTVTSALSKSITLEGEVAAESFIYYKILYSGNILFTLESKQGDADLYVSSKNVIPTYDPDTYDFQSSTCGIDSVFISKNLKRPIAIGVYGYFSYNQSHYALTISPEPEIPNYLEDFDEDEINADEDQSLEDESEIKRPGAKIDKKKLKSVSHSLWPLLELFELLFL